MAAVADGDDELEGLCVRAQGGDRSALRRVSDAAWANEPHRCGDGVALSPLWGLVEGGTERELVKVLMGRAAHGEEECRALAGLIRGQAVRASIIGNDDEDGFQSALVEVLEGGDKHALFALFILAVLVMDEPLGAEIFSPASVVQTVQWMISLIAADVDGDPAAARACFEVTKLLTMQAELVDAIERDDDTVARAIELICTQTSPGAVGIVYTLATASPAIARKLAIALAKSGPALHNLIETIRGGTAEWTAERMLMLAMRADPVPGKSLLKALLAAEGGIAMLATLTEQVFHCSSSQRSSGNASQGHSSNPQPSSQQYDDGTLVLTQDLHIHSQTDGDDESSDKVLSSSANAGGASADLVAHYEAVLSEERRNASELMKSMASTAAAERQAMQDEIDGLHTQMKEKRAKHELRVGKLTETAKRERERRVAIEGSCRREKDEAATTRRQLAAAKDDLAQAQTEAEKKEVSLRRDFEARLAEATDRLSAQEAEAEKRSVAWASEQQELWRKLVICLDGYRELETSVEIDAKRAEAEAAEMHQCHAKQLEDAGQALADCEHRCATVDRERQALTAELQEAQAQLYQLKKVSSLMSALIDTTNQPQSVPSTAPTEQTQRRQPSSDGTMDSPSLRSHSPSGLSYGSGRTGSGSESNSGSADSGREVHGSAREQPQEEGAILALSQTDQTPHRNAKAHLRQAREYSGGGSRRLRRCDATASIVGTSVRTSSASSTSSANSALSDAVSAVHNDVGALGLQLPTWSQAAADDSTGQGTVYYGSQETVQPAASGTAASSSARPLATAPTPEHSPAFEWQKEDVAANRNRRLAFLAMDPRGAGGSVMASTKPENRHSSESEDDDEGIDKRREASLDSLPLRRRDANAEPNSAAGRARRQREKLTLLRAEAGCTQPPADDDDDTEQASYHANDGANGYHEEGGVESPGITPVKSQREHSFGQSSELDDSSSTLEAQSPELF
eukprot:COSAG02_NODE_141_length_34311_cov_54.733135_10_plen_972_part_00